MDPSTTRISNDMNCDSPFRSTTPRVSAPTLYWQSRPSAYSGLYTYIWQPYREPPPYDYVKIHIAYNETPRNLRMILLFKNTRSFHSFRKLHEDLTKQRDADEAWSPVTEMVKAVFTVYQMILSDMSTFLQLSSNEVARLVRFAQTDDHNSLPAFANKGIDVRESSSSSYRDDTVFDTHEWPKETGAVGYVS